MRGGGISTDKGLDNGYLKEKKGSQKMYKGLFPMKEKWLQKCETDFLAKVGTSIEMGRRGGGKSGQLSE